MTDENGQCENCGAELVPVGEPEKRPDGSIYERLLCAIAKAEPASADVECAKFVGHIIPAQR
ncbi:hypothetical protein ETAA8_08750 [Anatilimnocola aggregata]|uniref:Uncharacterized protein n=1 Tax=Anatilimnocola aggregata TaxID=2528021 RepID=A0A517Y6E3_9BACT|nr:hypothetical protein ETAA8_08750 [Anatilimnocola aggregata]